MGQVAVMADEATSRALMRALQLLCVEMGAVVIVPAYGTVDADGVALWNQRLESWGLVATFPAATPFLFPDGHAGACLEVSAKVGG